jgi:DNA polymerase III alpha subunit
MQDIFEEIVAVEESSEEEVFDITVDNESHTFYANGISVSNCSHSLTYSVLSYQCAFLMTYYEPEWLCVYLQQNSNDDESKARAQTEVRKLGYTLGKVDINKSGNDWTVSEDGKTFFPSFRSAKGIGEAAVEEIVRNRPYKDVHDLLFTETGEWRHAKFNKRVFDVLCKLEAFESLDLVGSGKMFSSYRHMHYVLVDHTDGLKAKQSKKKIAQDVRPNIDLTDILETAKRLELDNLSREDQMEQLNDKRKEQILEAKLIVENEFMLEESSLTSEDKADRKKEILREKRKKLRLDELVSIFDTEENNRFLKDLKEFAPDKTLESKDRLEFFARISKDIPDWTPQQKAENHRELVGSVNPLSLISVDTRDQLTKKGIHSIDDIVNGTKDAAWFIVTKGKLMHTKATKKPYIMLDVTGESGTSSRMFCWNLIYPEQIPKLHTAYLAIVEKSDFGFALKKDLMELSMLTEKKNKEEIVE